MSSSKTITLTQTEEKIVNIPLRNSVSSPVASSSSSSSSPKFKVLAKESGTPIYQAPSKSITFSKKAPKIKKEDLKSKVPGAFVLRNALTKEECQQFIDLTEQMGFEEAKISMGSMMISMPEVRNNKRVIWQSDETVLKPIWERLKSFMPQEVTMGARKYRVLNMNERLRFYRYDGGEIFRKHFDGCFPRPGTDEVSILTLIVYLNEGFDGGHTTFFVNKKPYLVDPQTGSALLFFHGDHEDSPLHEGSVVKSGRKYVFRSDVMYSLVK